jgi:hypothetical protein
MRSTKAPLQRETGFKPRAGAKLQKPRFICYGGLIQNLTFA